VGGPVVGLRGVGLFFGVSFGRVGDDLELEQALVSLCFGAGLWDTDGGGGDSYFEESVVLYFITQC
jgi:hypothetical protein